MFGWGISIFSFFVLCVLGEIQAKQLNKAFSSGDYLVVIIISFFIGVFCQKGLSETIKNTIKK
jgi:uncharacterized membrane protein (DUF441 family)